MINSLKKITVFLTGLLLFSTMLMSQVTIGSFENPAIGAILDLKENEKGISTKGLVLPRVQLKKTNLILDTALGKEAEHTGLLVHHIKDEACVYQIPTGTYVWDGKMWNSLMEHSKDENIINAEFIVEGNPIPPSSEIKVSKGSTINLSVNATGSKSWTWTHNGTTISNAIEFQVTFAQDSDFGKYEVELNDGCDNVISLNLNIIAN